MRGGIWVLTIMPLVWIGAGLALTHRSLWWLLIALAVSGSILGWAMRSLNTVTPRAGGGNVGRTVAIWTAMEGIAIFVAANVLVNAHRSDAIMPAIAIIVGLHFFGLAKGIPVRSYYATGAGLIAAGAVALIAPPWQLPLAVGVTAALILWTSAIALVRQAA